jgi:hypothetical protein
MTFFDAMGDRHFKSGQDERILFFPWGRLGRGYAVGSHQEYERIRHRLGALKTIWLLLIVVTQFWSYGLAVIAIDLGVALYAAWVVYRVHGLNPSNERLPVTRSTPVNRGFVLAFLWLAEVTVIASFGLYIFILVVKPDNRLVTVAVLAFFALCAVAVARLLILWRRDSFRSPAEGTSA